MSANPATTTATASATTPDTSSRSPEYVDALFRGFSPATYARLKRGAQARRLTMAAYVSRLVALHEAILASPEHGSLEPFGLDRVSE